MQLPNMPLSQMKRRPFLTSALSNLAALKGLGQTASREQKNILFLIADDLGLHTGAYGDKTAITPNLDRLASQGVRFTNAFCTTASCSASRSVMMSGLHNHSSGHYGHAHDFHGFSYLPQIKSAPELLQQNGYKTGLIGKLHVNPLDRFAWDLNKPGGNRNVWGMAQTARTFMQQNQQNSWYLHVGFGDPHRAQKGFANQNYPNVKRTVFDPKKVQVPSFLPDNPQTREEVAEYYEASNRLDQGIGFFMDALKETGQLDKTLIVFISDNGMPFPNAKTNCYDAGAHLPMILFDPSAKKRGVVNQGLVSWVDLLPTFLDWSGTKGPDYSLHGRSVLKMSQEERPAGWDKVFLSHQFHEVTMYYPVRAVRTEKYKYIRNLFPELSFPHASDLYGSKTWQSVLEQGEKGKVGARTAGKYLHRSAEELYDITTDPDELNNLASQPAHRETLAYLRKEVDQFRKATKDPWLINDDYREPGQ
jgi:N-sulfoglucosamine sulfohydrolase